MIINDTILLHIKQSRSKGQSYASISKDLHKNFNLNVSDETIRRRMIEIENENAIPLFKTLNAEKFKRGLQDEKKKTKALIDHNLSIDFLNEAIQQAVSSINFDHPVKHVAPCLEGRPAIPMIAELVISDIQIGKITSEYNSATARKRMIEVGRVAIEKIQAHMAAGFNIEKIIVAFLGDIIESDRKHNDSARGCDSGTSEQISNAICWGMDTILIPLAELGIPLRVVGIGGNHDHDGHGMPMFKAGKALFTYPIYTTWKYIMEKMYSYVTFNIPDGVYAIETVYGKNICYEHGYFNKFDMKSLAARLNSRSLQAGKIIDYLRVGDKHCLLDIDDSKYTINGAFFSDGKGYEYSSNLGFFSKPAQQMFFYINKKDPLYDKSVIQLSHIK